MRWGILAGVLAASCATLSAEKGHREVAQVVEERLGHRTSWEQGVPEDAQVAARVDELLGKGLTRAAAIEIALVNSPELQATYEELGVSQADMVQAGLLANPTLEGSVGWGTGTFEYEGSLAQSFLDLFVLPLRKRVAEQQFEADTLRVAHEALATAAEVNKLFATLQAQVRRVVLSQALVQANEAGADLAKRQRDAGNITALALAEEQATYQQSKLELVADELEAAKLREELNQRLGLWGARTGWRLAEELPEIPSEEPPLERLESLAIRQRLDIDAARKQNLLLHNAVELARSSRLFGVVEVGVHAHQDPDGPRVFGPTLSLELPIFDRRGPMIFKLDAQRRQADRRLTGLSVNARSQVRLARLQLLTARNTVEHYRKVLLPLREQRLAETQLQYNGMQLGLPQLLEAKREEVEARKAHLEAVRDYWTARAELERAVGGRLPKIQAAGRNGDSRHEHH
jgi:cobalt-zinc-cadmium efflux system outer membrane protein